AAQPAAPVATADSEPVFVEAVLVAPGVGRLAAENGVGLPDLGQFDEGGADLLAKGEGPAGREPNGLAVLGRAMAIAAEQGGPRRRGRSEGHHHVTLHDGTPSVAGCPEEW